VLPLILFYVFATILVVSALAVILARNPVYCALSLVEAEFLAIVLVLVYVGAVMVLFLFVVMMLDINLEELRAGFTRFFWLGVITAGVIVFEIVGVVVNKTLGLDATRGAAPLPADYSNTRELGVLLYTKYTYPFEIAAMLLLVSIVAAIALTLRHRVGLKVQDISRQVSARASDRVRLVKMGAESRK
jgi:NADH-quinone oxidoreductase subunit J